MLLLIKNKIAGPQKSQIAIIFILLLAVIFLFMAILYNIRIVGFRNTTLSMSVDKSTLAAVSSVASYAKGLGKFVESGFNWDLFWSIIEIIAGPWGFVSIWVGIINFLAQMSAWANFAHSMVDSDLSIQIHEQVVMSVLAMNVDDTKLVLDVYDDDMDEKTDDYIPRLVAWYGLRNAGLDAAQQDVIKKIGELADLLQDFAEYLIGCRINNATGPDACPLGKEYEGREEEIKGFYGHLLFREKNVDYYDIDGTEVHPNGWLHGLHGLLNELDYRGISVERTDGEFNMWDIGKEIWRWPKEETNPDPGPRPGPKRQDYGGFTQWLHELPNDAELLTKAFEIFFPHLFNRSFAGGDWFSIFYGPYTEGSCQEDYCPHDPISQVPGCPGFCRGIDDKKLPYDCGSPALGIYNLLDKIRRNYEPGMSPQGLCEEGRKGEFHKINSLKEIYYVYGNDSPCHINCDDFDKDCKKGCKDQCGEDNPDCITQCEKDTCREDRDKAINCKKIKRVTNRRDETRKGAGELSVEAYIDVIDKYEAQVVKFRNRLANFVDSIKMDRPIFYDWDPTYCWLDDKGLGHCIWVRISDIRLPMLRQYTEHWGWTKVTALEYPKPEERNISVQVFRYDESPQDAYRFWKFKYAPTADIKLGIVCDGENEACRWDKEAVKQIMLNHGMQKTITVRWDCNDEAEGKDKKCLYPQITIVDKNWQGRPYEGPWQWWYRDIYRDCE